MLGIACPILHRAAFPEPVQDGRQLALAFHAAYLPCSLKPRFQNPQPTVQQPPKTIPASSSRTRSRHRRPDDSRSNTNCRSGKSTCSAFFRHAEDSKPRIYTRYALARFPAAAPHRKLESALTAQINRSWSIKPFQQVVQTCLIVWLIRLAQTSRQAQRTERQTGHRHPILRQTPERAVQAVRPQH